MDKLNELRLEYYSIDGLPEPQRTLQLSNLMDELKQEYNIPLINRESYNTENKEVIQLYREVASSRNI